MATTNQTQTIIILVVTIILTSIVGGYFTKSHNVPEQLSSINTTLNFIKEDLETFATKDQVSELEDDIKEFKIEFKNVASTKELKSLDDRVRSEKRRNELVQERLYKSVLENQKQIAENQKRIQGNF